jgi:Poly A polymerase regulatory subunit
LYEDIRHRLKYRSGSGLVKHNIHVGQVKLFLTELQFLTEQLESYEAEAIMIYAGSAPCHHMAYLCGLFPNVKMIMVDPEEHLVYFDAKSTHFDGQWVNKCCYFKATLKNRFGLKRSRKIRMFNGQGFDRLDKDLDQDRITELGSEFDLAIKGGDMGQIVDFILADEGRMFFIEDLFGDDLARLGAKLKASGACPVYFISDIRSNVLGMIEFIERVNGVKTPYKAKTATFGQDHDESPGAIDLLWNNALQLQWLKIMKCDKWMLKFRPSFFEAKEKEMVEYFSQLEPYRGTFEACKGDVDFVGEFKKGKFIYLKSDCIYLQAFAGPISTEARLVGDSVDEFTNYDPVEYEDKFYYYNRVERHYGYHKAYKAYWNEELGLDACGDCSLMIRLFEEYMVKFRPEVSMLEGVKGHIRGLLGAIRRSLKANDNLHGHYLAPYAGIEAIIAQQHEYKAFMSKIWNKGH